jgi:hypothetical protein
MAERPKSECSHLDQLNPEWNSNDGDASQKTNDPIINGNQESTQHKPKNVT